MNEEHFSTDTPRKSSRLFISGVLILTFSNILIKVIGLTLKIPLHHLLGGVGMAYYTTAYDIYVWLYMISTAGLPVAVSLLISESRSKGNFREAKRIFKITLALFFAIGLIGMAVMLFGSRLFAAAYKYDEAYLAIMAIAPTLFFICISSAIRGYFQGYQNMFPTAISQIIEALGKLIIGILLAYYGIAHGYDLPTVAAMTILGLTIGVAAGMLFLVISKLLFKSTSYDAEYLKPDSDTMEVRPAKTLLKLLVFAAIPITLSSSVMSFTNVLDGIILSRRLQSIGYTKELTLDMTGNYKALAISMYNVPPALIYPISYSMVPLLSATVASGDKERSRFIMASSMKIAALIALPCALGMSALSEPILAMLFNAEDAHTVAPLLSVLSLSVFFIGMLAMSNAILQAHRHESKPIISIVIGSVVKLISSFVLIGIPAINIFGAPIGTFLCYFAVCAVNFYFMAKYIGFIPSITEIFIRPLFASLLCAGTAIGVYKLIDGHIPQKLSTLIAIAAAAAVYLVAVFIFRCISKDDILLLPKGKKLYAALHKLKLVK